MVVTISSSAGLEELVLVVVAAGLAGLEQRRAGHEVLHDGAEDGGLELRPFAVGLGDGDEVGAEEHAVDALDGEQPLRQRRFRGVGGLAQVERAGFEHGLPGQELQGRRIGRGFGLDEHRLFSFAGNGFKARAAQITIADKWRLRRAGSTAGPRGPIIPLTAERQT